MVSELESIRTSPNWQDSDCSITCKNLVCYLSKPIDRTVARAWCHGPDIGREPAAQLRVEVVQIAKAAPRQEVVLDVLHARFALALGLGPIGSADARSKAPILGTSLQLDLPAHSGLFAAEHYSAHAVVENLVCAQQLPDAVLIALRSGATRIAQRQHEEVHWLFAQFLKQNPPEYCTCGARAASHWLRSPAADIAGSSCDPAAAGRDSADTDSHCAFNR